MVDGVAGRCYTAIMIQQLLKYQDKEKEKLHLVLGVEGGRIKRDLDENTRAVDEAKKTLLNLENEAKALSANFASIQKNVTEILAKMDKLETPKGDNEDDLHAAVNYAATLNQKLVGYENQLNDILKRINQKAAQFEALLDTVKKSQGQIATLTAAYERQTAELNAKVKPIEEELKKMASTIDAKLLERYKKARGADKSGKAVDVVVPLAGNTCGGCRFELPLSLIHKMTTNGYIVCEECGKLIYK